MIMNISNIDDNDDDMNAHQLSQFMYDDYIFLNYETLYKKYYNILIILFYI